MNRSGEMSVMFMPRGVAMPRCLMSASARSLHLFDEVGFGSFASFWASFAGWLPILRQRRNSRHPSTAASGQHATWHVAEAANRSGRTQTFVAERAAFIGALRILLEDGV